MTVAEMPTCWRWFSDARIVGKVYATFEAGSAVVAAAAAVGVAAGSVITGSFAVAGGWSDSSR